MPLPPEFAAVLQSLAPQSPTLPLPDRNISTACVPPNRPEVSPADLCALEREKQYRVTNLVEDRADTAIPGDLPTQSDSHSRIDLVPSIQPVLARPDVGATTSAPTASPVGIQQHQVVEYMALARNDRGLDELRLRMDSAHLGRLSLSMVQVGDRTIEISVREGTLADAALVDLGQRLRAKGLEMIVV